MSTKYTLQDMQNLAETKGGRCLSEKYLNTSTKLKWECSKGHFWNAPPAEILRGRWCRQCANDEQKLDIGLMKQIALSKGGECLSSDYIDANTNLAWKCQQGHVWEAPPKRIRSGGWCPFCQRISRRLTIEEIKALAKERGGKCLSNEYINNRTKLLWECQEGHQWWAIVDHIKGRGVWCPTCGGTNKLTIEDMQQIAKQKGGECLSQTYVNGLTKLKWKCANGHIWWSTPFSVKFQSWCPACNSNLTEEKCRFILEFLLDKKFSKTRKALGNGMELDGYNDEIKLAFEYHGEQHYVDIPHFRKNGNKDAFAKRQSMDKKKTELCKDLGIRLIVIPYYKSKELGPYILEQLRELNISVSKETLDVPWEKLEYDNTLSIICNIAKKKGGKCLSEEYVDDNTKLDFECGVGHRWSARPHDIKRGSWCAVCAGMAKGTLQEMQEIASRRGGKCLSTEYKNRHSKLLWECEEGHQWRAVPANIISQNQWCPRCAGRVKLTIYDMKALAESKGGKCLSVSCNSGQDKLLWECDKGHRWAATGVSVKFGSWCAKCQGVAKLTIEDMRTVASEKGGKCLSQEYKNGKDRLLWECDKGHQWMASGNNVKNGSWCPICYRAVSGNSRRLTIEDMKQIAIERGGKCLSSVYYDSKTKLLWECSEGHQWEAVPNHIKNGRWCPECAKKKRGQRVNK